MTALCANFKVRFIFFNILNPFPNQLNKSGQRLALFNDYKFLKSEVKGFCYPMKGI